MELTLLANNLLEEIRQVKTSTPRVNEQALKTIVLCRNLLALFRKEIVHKGFENEAEEIHFFKEIKQIPLAQLLFHKEIFAIEAKIPIGDIDQQIIFIKKQIKLYNQFFQSNIDFGQYIALGNTDYDLHYYTRQPKTNYSISMSSYADIMDPEFNTPKDMLLGRFKAFGLANQYATSKLTSLTSADKRKAVKVDFNLNCNASKTDIIELIYSMIASGAIQGDIKELSSALELILDIELGDIYRTFIAIRSRTNDPTKFLDTLKMALLRKIEESDD